MLNIATRKEDNIRLNRYNEDIKYKDEDIKYKDEDKDKDKDRMKEVEDFIKNSLILEENSKYRKYKRSIKKVAKYINSEEVVYNAFTATDIIEKVLIIITSEKIILCRGKIRPLIASIKLKDVEIIDIDYIPNLNGSIKIISDISNLKLSLIPSLQIQYLYNLFSKLDIKTNRIGYLEK
jgi:hypothetical protein